MRRVDSFRVVKFINGHIMQPCLPKLAAARVEDDYEYVNGILFNGGTDLEVEGIAKAAAWAYPKFQELALRHNGTWIPIIEKATYVVTVPAITTCLDSGLDTTCALKAATQALIKGTWD